MATYKYKNTSDQELTLVGFGVVKPGGMVRSAVPIENPNLEAIAEETEPVAAQTAAAEAPQDDQPEQPNQNQE